MYGVRKGVSPNSASKTIWPLKTSLPLVTIPEIEERITEYLQLFHSLPRSHPDRPTLLRYLAGARSQRFGPLRQKSDLDKAITHLTEAVLLSSAQRIVFPLFHLAALLHSRYTYYKRRDDLKSSIKYFRFLRTNFHSLEAFDIPHASGDLSTHLFTALAHNLVLTRGEMVQDLGEMVPLIPEIIIANTLTYHQKNAIKAFNTAVIALSAEIFRRKDTQPIADRAIQLLREATVLNPDLEIAYALAMCLTCRFDTTRVINDCEEALNNFDRVIATCSPGKDLTPMESGSVMPISGLLVSRANLSPTPENLEDAIQRLRTLVSYPLGDEHHTMLTMIISAFTGRRFEYFGVAGSSGGTPPDKYFASQPNFYLPRSPGENVSQIQEKMDRLSDFITAIMNGDDVEAAVEASRKLIPLRQSSNQWSRSSELDFGFAGVLWSAYQHTERLDYLNEAITTYQDLYKITAAPKLSHFEVKRGLSVLLSVRFRLLGLRQDLEELMQLCSEIANDSSGEVFIRFEISCFWADTARVNLLPSASMAYETAMSLLQETLVFCPTLQTQHHRLAGVLKKVGNFPSDYASYRAQNGQAKQAIETLERGRALIWSEMRGLRTSTDQLRTADPALADKFTDLNQRLESVMMSVTQGDDDEIGRTETGAGRENTISHHVLTQRRLLAERNTLITRIQSSPGFEHFLKLPPFDFLNAAASHGPVIIVNQSHSSFPSHIILLRKDSRPFLISTPPSFYDRSNQLENELLRVRKKKGLDSEEYNLTLTSVLADLYELVGKPVIERLRKLKVREKSRVWWCPTGAFCSLPLHAMGPIPSDDGKDLYFSDLYMPSYTPTLSALIESRKRGSSSDESDRLKPSILLVAQPDTLPGAFGEIKAIEATKTQVNTLISAMATPDTVIAGLRDHRFAHFVCHGLLEAGKPFDASLELHKNNLTLLAIVRSQLPAAEFAFLSACHTAELTEGSVADEALHLAAAMQYCGFRSTVGTMWAMADTDGADLSKHFYKAIFADKADQNLPYHERSARALQIAVKKLRKKRGMTLERWVNFVHYGA